MAVWAVGVEYLGTRYHGWQAQTRDGAVNENVTTVQHLIERALAKVNAAPVKTICAGRTDAGVHALNQVFHFETDSVRSERAWLLGVNQELPHDISLRFAKIVPNDFHARFSALSRRYLYVIDNRQLSRPATFGMHTTWIYYQLDAKIMQDAANVLIGRHDFSAFRSSNCQAHSPIRTIYDFSVRRDGHLITIDVTANAFLHHMVRNLVGTLLKVGCGEWDVARVANVLASKDRREAAITAKPNGLYFADVTYPPHYGIPRLEASAFLSGCSIQTRAE